MEWLLANYMTLITGLSMIIAGASVIVKLTPTAKDDAIIAKLQKVIELIALNKK